MRHDATVGNPGLTKQRKILILVLALAAWVPALVTALSPAQSGLDNSVPETTVKRLRETGWWPTKRDAARKDYAGSEACAECHQQEVLDQRRTSMAKAASRAVETEILRANPTILLDSPPFLTSIKRGQKGSTYTVARGGEAKSGQIVWTMGAGSMGQTFIVESGGESGSSLFESQLSYFTSIGALDLTPGHLPSGNGGMEKAFGVGMSEGTAQQCFGCHTTASSVRGRFDPDHATPGVGCELCHGPGRNHIDAMRQGRIAEDKSAILNPDSLDPVRQIDYCGACHRAPLDVAAAKDYLPINVRFQPYRLAKSRCWSRPDRRIACLACHNPHEEVERDTSFYDAKCLACHASRPVSAEGGGGVVAARVSGLSVDANHKLPACPVSGSHCTSCHMPKYTVPQMHGSFTDHDIRVVRAGSVFPL